MSNPQVGPIYQQIIADVVESSRVDFEEGGVEEQVLEELRQVWPHLSTHREPSHRISPRHFPFYLHLIWSFVHDSIPFASRYLCRRRPSSSR